MVRAVERRRRRFWKPKSVEQHPDWPKKIAHARQALPAYDQLPAEVRAAMREAHHDFGAVQLLDLWKRTEDAMSTERRIAYLVDAIKQNDRQMDEADRAKDAAMSSRRNPAGRRQ